MSKEPQWTASWTATGLTIGQIILVIVLGGGEIAWLRYVGFAPWALAAVFGRLPIYQFKRRGGVARGDSYVKTTMLVDTGLYAVVRHPQFVAWPLMNAAVALVCQHPVVIVMGAVAFAVSSMDSGRSIPATSTSSATHTASTWKEWPAGTSLRGSGAGGIVKRARTVPPRVSDPPTPT
jgi:hypothetical protein